MAAEIIKGIQAESRDFHCIFCFKMRFLLFFKEKNQESLIWGIFILKKCTHRHLYSTKRSEMQRVNIIYIFGLISKLYTLCQRLHQK